MEESKELVLSTMRYLNSCALPLHDRIFDELKKYIENQSGDVFENDFASIDASCKLLRTITKTSIDNDRRKSLTEELRRESTILYRSLSVSTKVKEYPYTPLQILLKLEILFDSLLDHSKVCHDTNFELSKCILQTEDDRSMELNVLTSEKKCSMLLRELTDAVLDDMITFLMQNKKTFYDFYNYDRISYVVFRLRNFDVREERSINVYDKLCVYIVRELTQKYQLDIKRLIKLLLDQFESIDDSRYRKKLIGFVENVFLEPYKLHTEQDPECVRVEFLDSLGSTPFTFGKFFQCTEEDPFLNENDQNEFRILFEIYCQKLAGIIPSAKSEPPPETDIGSQSEDWQTRRRRKNRRRNKQSRKNNLTNNPVIDDDTIEDVEFSHNAEQYVSRTVMSGGSSQYKSEEFRDRREWNDNSYSSTHRPRRRTNKRKPWAEQNN